MATCKFFQNQQNVIFHRLHPKNLPRRSRESHPGNKHFSQFLVLQRSIQAISHVISQTTYNLNSELLVCYSSHDLNNEPFNEQTILDHLNTKLVRYSDPHCTPDIILCILLCYNFNILELFACPLGLKFSRLRNPDLEEPVGRRGFRYCKICLRKP